MVLTDVVLSTAAPRHRAPSRLPHHTRRALRRVMRWALNFVALTGVVCVLATVAMLFSGGRIVTFASDSMSPAIPVGSLAVTLPTALQDLGVGDVISVPRPIDQQTVTHRVVEVVASGDAQSRSVTLRGDANKADDFPAYKLSGDVQRLILHVPWIGYAASYLQSPWVWGSILCVIVILLLPSRRKP